MIEDEIRQIVRDTVRETLKESLVEQDLLRESIRNILHEWFADRYPRPFFERDAERLMYSLHSEVSRLSSFLGDLEVKWAGAPNCLYEKAMIAAIKTDTTRIP